MKITPVKKGQTIHKKKLPWRKIIRNYIKIGVWKWCVTQKNRWFFVGISYLIVCCVLLQTKQQSGSYNPSWKNKISLYFSHFCYVRPVKQEIETRNSLIFSTYGTSRPTLLPRESVYFQSSLIPTSYSALIVCAYCCCVLIHEGGYDYVELLDCFLSYWNKRPTFQNSNPFNLISYWLDHI